MIDLTDIHVTFNKDTPLETRALRGVDLHVPKGQFLTVIGSNGAGKSTALNVMAGIAPAEQGSLRVGDFDMTNWPVHKRAPYISRVFQDPKMGTCEDLTILENFALAFGRTKPRGFRFAVDPAIRTSVADRLSVLMVTHSMAQALHTGDRTIMFHQGKIIFDVAGETRDNMQVEDLLHLFKREQGEELADDSLLLG